MNNDRRKTINSLISQLEEVLEAIDEVMGQEQEAFDNMPEGLQQGDAGVKAEEAIGNLDNAKCDVENVISALGDAAE